MDAKMANILSLSSDDAVLPFRETSDYDSDDDDVPDLG